MNIQIDNLPYDVLGSKFEKECKDISEIMNFTFDRCEIGEKIKKSSDFVLVNYINSNGNPLFSFIYNKGFTKGKTMCLICTHKYSETEWRREVTFPHYKNGDIWEKGDFVNQKRAKLIHGTFIEDVSLWTNNTV